jgi:hypothetical protein
LTRHSFSRRPRPIRSRSARHDALGKPLVRTGNDIGRDPAASQPFCLGANSATARFPESKAGQRRATSLLTIHVGDADLLFGGFIDATAIRRDVNTGSGVGTSFGTIPFGNTVQGHMNDMQFSSQNSRLTLEATAKNGAADLKGSLEADFQKGHQYVDESGS